jgi:Holliday junction resolvase
MEQERSSVRRAAKVDANQSEIVRALRECGATVLSLAAMGKGCPDLLVGRNSVNLLMEIKDPSQKPSQRKLTDDEKEFHAAWRGNVFVIETVEEAIITLETYT